MKWFRPNIVSILAIAVTVGFFLGRIDPQAFFGFAVGLVTWWFKSRDDDKNKGR